MKVSGKVSMKVKKLDEAKEFVKKKTRDANTRLGKENRSLGKQHSKSGEELLNLRDQLDADKSLPGTMAIKRRSTRFACTTIIHWLPAKCFFCARPSTKYQPFRANPSPTNYCFPKRPNAKF